MRKLALSDEILMKVDKAARYIGGEVPCASRMSMKSFFYSMPKHNI